jgi:hypothetical protein
MKHRAAGSAIILCLATFIISLAVPAAQAADIFYDAAIKGAYEDNVVGLLSDKRGGYAGMPATGAGGGVMMAPGMGPGGGMGGSIPQDTGTQSKSDTSINIFADIGVLTKISPDTNLFLIGGAQHTSYSSFTQFDFTIGGLSAGVYKGFGDVFSGKFAINGAIKNYQDSQRNSTAYGATLNLRERLTPIFWLRETYDYEQNNADSPLFTYTGNSGSIWAGLSAMHGTTFLLGYNYLVRDYNEPSGFKVTASTISLGVEHELVKKWYIDARYDHQISDSNVPGTNSTDNIYSIGFRYSY